MLELVIEKMTKSDVCEVADLEKICFSRPWSEKSLLDELTNNTAFFIVAKLKDKVVGYVGMNEVLKEGYITNLAVLPKYRGFGIGTALLEYIIDYAKKNNFIFVTLEVRQSNRKAILLYHRSGFKEVGRRKQFYSCPKEDAIILTLNI